MVKSVESPPPLSSLSSMIIRGVGLHWSVPACQLMSGFSLTSQGSPRMMLHFSKPVISKLTQCRHSATVISSMVQCVISPWWFWLPSTFHTTIGQWSSVFTSCSLLTVSSSIKFPPAPESMSANSCLSFSRCRMVLTSMVCRVTSRSVIELMPIEKW